MKEEIIQNINQEGLEAAYINGNLASNLEYKTEFLYQTIQKRIKKVISSIGRRGYYAVNNSRLVWHLSQWEELRPSCRER